ncbi:TIGR03619 family F420-dependent LLM class oxidoreductase [Myxococcota bacterium]|nr:TIGR03619 family F420-dependent LLM class oxidoreductase [Myxococcota bacterium]
MKYILGLPTDDMERREEFGTVAALTELGRAAEEYGYTGVYVTDHPAPTPKYMAQGGHHDLDPPVALAVVAAATERLKLMTNLYILAFRKPFAAAKALATLDSVSGGRLIFGTGTGYVAPEFSALGADFDQRNEHLDESLETLKKIWTGEPVEGSGRDFRAVGNFALPTPFTRPHPPIWIGGNSRRAIRRVAEHGDGWLPMRVHKKMARFVHSAAIENLQDLRERIQYLDEQLKQVGRRDPVDVMLSPVALGYGKTNFDRGALREELTELTALGVSHAGVTFSFPGSGELETRSQLLKWMEAFANDLIRT